ncbi:hypothetical protein [Zoogloea sp.]|uniref:hypothetical protein n=1 Tax=Zoogloea sp. TaxID=49181 RepID=UPI0025EB73C2|nr:hypothetical protein [Zoogloea sp.]MCK6395071.1 hypothetical protein [Zoogloea sp.]
MSSKLRHLSSRRQHGVVLAVVLVVLVVMMLGSVSLLNSVDTSALLSGNIGFKRDSINSAGRGLNKAFETMKSANFRSYQDSIVGCPPPANTGTACSAAGEWAKLNFYPRMLESDENGIPLIIKNKTQFDAMFKIAPLILTEVGPNKNKDGNEVRFLIERMCEAYGPSNKVSCVLSTDSPLGGDGWAEKPGSTASPLYRVTVRTDGVRNSQTYAQWTVTFLEE